MKSAVLDELRHSFRPEFLNRIDDIIVFHALNEEHLKQIVEIQLEGLRQRLQERHITLELTDAARTSLVKSGFDPVYGARPLKRAIQKQIETHLGRMIIKGELPDGSKLMIDADGSGELKFRTARLRRRLSSGLGGWDFDRSKAETTLGSAGLTACATPNSG